MRKLLKTLFGSKVKVYKTKGEITVKIPMKFEEFMNSPEGQKLKEK